MPQTHNGKVSNADALLHQAHTGAAKPLSSSDIASKMADRQHVQLDAWSYARLTNAAEHSSKLQVTLQRAASRVQQQQQSAQQMADSHSSSQAWLPAYPAPALAVCSTRMPESDRQIAEAALPAGHSHTGMCSQCFLS